MKKTTKFHKMAIVAKIAELLNIAKKQARIKFQILTAKIAPERYTVRALPNGEVWTYRYGMISKQWRKSQRVGMVSPEATYP